MLPRLRSAMSQQIARALATEVPPSAGNILVLKLCVQPLQPLGHQPPPSTIANRPPINRVHRDEARDGARHKRLVSSIHLRE